MKEFRLINGIAFPAVGYGTYLATQGTGSEAIAQAIEVGYRYLDTASFYMNEEQVGEALKDSGIERSKIQICSKLWRTQLGYENALKAFDESINKLRCDYLDLYLIHWPKKEDEEPCDECLDYPSNENSQRPTKFKEKGE